MEHLAEVMSRHEGQEGLALFQHLERAQSLAEDNCDLFLLLLQLVFNKISEVCPVHRSFQVPAQSLVIKQAILHSKHDVYISQMSELTAVVRNTNTSKGSFERLFNNLFKTLTSQYNLKNLCLNSIFCGVLLDLSAFFKEWMMALDEFQQQANPDTLQPFIMRCYEHFGAFDKAVTELGFNPDVMQHVKALKQNRKHGLGIRACKTLEFLCDLSSELLFKDTTEDRQKRVDNSFFVLESTLFTTHYIFPICLWMLSLLEYCCNNSVDLSEHISSLEYLIQGNKEEMVHNHTALSAIIDPCILKMLLPVQQSSKESQHQGSENNLVPASGILLHSVGLVWHTVLLSFYSKAKHVSVDPKRIRESLISHCCHSSVKQTLQNIHTELSKIVGELLCQELHKFKEYILELLMDQLKVNKSRVSGVRSEVEEMLRSLLDYEQHLDSCISEAQGFGKF